jgi:hypothetical protein
LVFIGDPVGWSLCLLERARGYLELRNLAARVESAVRHPIRASLASPVVEDRQGIRANGLHHHCLQGHVVSARGYRDPIPILYLILLREARVNFEASHETIQCADSNL